MDSLAKALFAVCFVIVLGSLSGAVNEEGNAEPVVRTPLGALRGTTMKSRSGRTIYAFRGVRYALPPTGERRFRAPVAAKEKWSGITNATEDGPSCPQAGDYLPPSPISEDCLFLNVYTTNVRNQETTTPHPVIVWFHHGAWADLSGQCNLIGPQYLMDEDVVFVSINYRLAALGFLSTGDSVAPGNNGLKDQVVSLEWVRDNIAYFGGDPNSVTIYGYSAGAASVQYHLVSPLSAGLFHRAISGSGSALSLWSLARDPKEIARRNAKVLNCPHDENASSQDIIDCLRTKDANEIAKSYRLIREWAFESVLYAPVIEAEGSSSKPFLTADPESLLQSGNFSQVPWLTGFTNNESILGAMAILANQTWLDDLNRNFEQIMPIILQYERDTPASRRISQRIKEFYLGGGEITQDSMQALTDMFTECVFLYGADRSVKIMSRISRAPVYYYQYTYRGRFGHVPREPGMEKPPGAAHHDDLIYVFYAETLFPYIESTFPEALTSRRLVKMWANFAKTGNPTPDPKPRRDSLLPTVWLPHTPSSLSYLEIGDELKMKRALRQDKAAFWNQLLHPTHSHSKTP